MAEDFLSNKDQSSDDDQPKKKQNRRRLSDLPSLRKDTKEVMAEKINYFKTMPEQVKDNVGNLQNPVRVPKKRHITHKGIKSSVSKGRISILNISDTINFNDFNKSKEEEIIDPIVPEAPRKSNSGEEY